MFEALSFGFVQNALIAVVLLSVAVGIIGSLIVVNRLVFLSGGVAHSAYGGVGLAFFVGFSPLLGATIAGVLSAIAMSWVLTHHKDKSDSFIGVIWAVGMALGVIFADLTEGYSINLMSYLFGSLMAIDRLDLIIFLLLDLIIIAVVAIYYHKFVALSFDPVFAKIKGVKVQALNFVLMLLASLVVVMAIRIVGLMLVVALITIPTWIASKYANSLATMMGLTTIIALVFSVIGFVLSYMLNLTSGAMIIIALAVAFIINEVITRKA